MLRAIAGTGQVLTKHEMGRWMVACRNAGKNANVKKRERIL